MTSRVREPRRGSARREAPTHVADAVAERQARAANPPTSSASAYGDAPIDEAKGPTMSITQVLAWQHWIEGTPLPVTRDRR
jgi:hypothetical protein